MEIVFFFFALFLQDMNGEVKLCAPELKDKVRQYFQIYSGLLLNGFLHCFYMEVIW